MEFIKWFVNKHGILVGGGSLVIVFLFVVGLAVMTRGMILVIVPILLAYFVGLNLLDYFSKDK